MRNVRLIFGSTNSQPVGTTDDDIEQVYQHSYKPFLRALYNSPSFHVTLHYSGQLLQWLERHHSEYTDVLSEMVGRKQTELLGGGFYDPVLSLIPRVDRVGQIESLTTYLRKRFGRRPRGTWITQHVWEPSLASTLKTSGMEYVFLDEFHFLAAGLPEDELTRPCITEDQGKTVVAFPVSYELRRIAREGTPEDAITWLQEHANNDPSQVFALIDDGERYHDPTVANGTPARPNVWLERFVELVEANPWISVELPGHYLKQFTPRARGYFAGAAHEQAMYSAFALDHKESLDKLRARFTNGNGGSFTGSSFRHFLTSYPESNLMYAKMQYTHVLVNQIRGDKYRKLAAREELWKAQCHSAYWHGDHCGIYNNRLRKHVYRSLIEAEKKTRERGIFNPSVVTIDFDMDGLEEFLYQGHDMNAYVHAEGGMLFELDYLPTCWNYLDTMARRREAYHGDKEASEGYDAELRKSFLDRFIDPALTPEEFAHARFTERGSFTRTIYERSIRKRDTHLITLTATGTVRIGDIPESAAIDVDAAGVHSLDLTKRYRFKRNTVEVEYTFSTSESEPCELLFAPELNFSFLSDDPDSLGVTARKGGVRETRVGSGIQDVPHATDLIMRDLVNRTMVTVSSKATSSIWVVPVETAVTNSECSMTIYQGTSIVPRLPVRVEPSTPATVVISVRIERM